MKAILLSICSFLTFELVINASAIAQPTEFKGNLVEKETKLAIPYANIYSNHSGVYSNTDGSFDFKFDKTGKNDTIIISCIGFKSIKILADSLNSGSFYRIEMSSHTTRLNEVIISDKRQKISAEEIVSKAIGRLREFYPTDEYALEAFYKQTNLLTNPTSKDTEYLRYLEAALYIISINKGKQTTVIREVRRSDDNRFQFFSKEQTAKREQILKEEQRFDLSSNLLSLDYMKMQRDLSKNYKNTYSLLDPSIGNLNNDFVNRHKFKLDTIALYNDEIVYVIKVLPTKYSVGIKSGLLKDYFLPIGRLYISGSDFSILEIQYSYILNPKKKDKINLSLVKLMNQGEFVFKDVVKYKRKADKLYLSYIMREQGDTLFIGGYNYSNGLTKNDEQIKNNSYFKVKRELFVTKTITNTDDVAKIDLTSKYITLFPATYEYNKIFWNDLNKMVITSYERKKLDFLGKGKPIEDQFVENGKQKK